MEDQEIRVCESCRLSDEELLVIFEREEETRRAFAEPRAWDFRPRIYTPLDDASGVWLCFHHYDLRICDGCEELDILEHCGGSMYCENCRENLGYWWCESCEEYRRGSCECEEEEQETSRLIHDYGYKPAPIFYPPRPDVLFIGSGEFADQVALQYPDGRRVEKSSRLYFGIELETESRSGSTSDGAELFCGRIDENEAFLKYDGSLADGFEIVTHPRTLAEWQAWDKFGEVLADLARSGFRAWETETAGLHVNIDRSAFTAAHLWRFVSLISKNPREVKNFAGRESSYARFGGSGLDSHPILQKMHGYGWHSDAVNLGHPLRVEVRVFRPSLRFGTVLGAIEFCHAAYEYTRSLSVADIYAGAISWGGFVAFAELRRDTYPNAVARFERIKLEGGRF